jgi:hypothetical protein
MKLDTKKRVSKINGFYIKGPEMEDDEDEQTEL